MSTHIVRPQVPNEEFRIWCSDLYRHFQFDHKYEGARIRQKLREELSLYEFFPGLVLEDIQGRRWAPALQVVLVPVEQEERFHAGERVSATSSDGQNTEVACAGQQGRSHPTARGR